MKNSLLVLVFAMGLIFQVSAQDAKMWLGGTLGISSVDNGINEQSTTTFMPEFGYHLNEKWAIGGRVGFSNTKEETVATTRKINTTSIVPFARYTFGNPSAFSFFGQGELPLNFYGGDIDSDSSIGVRIRPGFSYAFSQKWGLHMMMPPVLSYESGPGDLSSFRLRVNDGYSIQEYIFNAQIGFVYRF